LSEEFHYVRTLGADGGVDAIEGPAIGLDLESILKDGLPPFSVALEIIAGCCEMLDISDEDGELHANIEPKFIFLDDTGALSIEGFGSDRPSSRAPETEQDTLTDLYGLGYLAFSLFSPNPPTSLPMDDPDDHDDAVIDSVLTINFDNLPEEMVGDVQWYIAKLLSFEPEDRPTAVDAWRTFIAFADACEGPDFIDWCAAALEGEGERRDADQAARSMAPPPEEASADETEEEDLGGPVMSAGPLKKGMQLGGGSAPKGQATAFWSKDAMKAALAQEETEEEEEGAFRPSVGGGAATSFWSKEQMQAMASGKAEAPRPKRGAGGGRSGKQRPSTSFQPDSAAAGPASKAEEPEEDEVPTVVATPSPVSASPAIAGPTPAAHNQGEAQKSSKLPMIIGGIVVLLIVVCGVAGLGSGLIYSMSGDEDKTTTAPSVAPAPKTKSKPTRDTGQPEGKTKEAPKPITPIAAPKTAPKPKPKPRPKPKPKPAPTGGPAKVSFTAAGRGKLTCSGVKKEFDGSASLTFQPYELPVSCMIDMEGKKGSFWVKGSGSISCNPSGGSVVCNKPEVP
jgi:hypothetical protein